MAGSSLYIADGEWRVIRKVNLVTGAEIVYAGTGQYTHGGDGGPADEASFDSVQGIVLDSAGNLFVADPSAARVRRIDAATGLISTYAGDGNSGSTGDGGPATAASIRPSDIALDPAGNLFISGEERIRRVDATTGVITTYAGTGLRGFSGDGGPATAARFKDPGGLATDSAGNLYVSDASNFRVRRIDATTGIITTYAGNGNAGTPANLGDGGPATSAELWVPQGLSVGPDDDLYISDQANYRIRRVDAATGIITTAAGSTPNFVGPRDEGDGGPATSAELDYPFDVTVAANGDFYVATYYSFTVRGIIAATGLIDTVAGNRTGQFGGDGGPGAGAQFGYTAALTFGPGGDMYVATFNVYRVRAVSPGDVTSTLAGNGDYQHSGDGGPATNAGMPGAAGVAADAAGNVYVADGTSRIRRIDTSGTITTYAGGENQGWSGDGGPATAAQLWSPWGLAIGPDGDLFVADLNNNVIRRIDAGTGTITTVAGDGSAGYSGDGGPATNAQLNGARGVTLDVTGNLFIADNGNSRIRRVDAGTGIISTVAGNGGDGYAGDGGPAASAEITYPQAVELDPSGNLYIAEEGRVRRVDASTQVISTVAGSTLGFSGDGGPATAAHFGGIADLAIGPDGDLYIADGDNLRIRRLELGSTPANRPPAAQDQSTTTPEDTAKGITLVGSDPDGDTLTFELLAGPSHGTLSGAVPTLTYTPTANYHGPDSFTFRASDGREFSNTGTISITVSPVNDPPVANGQVLTTPEDSSKPVVLTATDVDGDAVTYQVVAFPTRGGLFGSGANRTYAPNANYNGADSFTFRASDGTALSNTATVSLSITPVNDAPVAQSLSYSLAEDTSRLVTFLASDVDGDALSYQIVSPPAHGGLSGGGTNRTYAPNASYNGPDSFTYRVSDGIALSNTATVSLSITPVNDVPVVEAWRLTKQTEGFSTCFCTFGSFTDPDGQSAARYKASIAWGDGKASAGNIVQIAPGYFEVEGSHTWKRFGTYTIQVTVTDLDGGSASDTTTTKILDAAISAASMGQGFGTVGKAWSVRVGCFSDDNPFSAKADLTVIIKWGDGKSSEETIKAGTAQDKFGGTCSGWDYGVFGSHTYAKKGTYNIKYVITSVGGSKATGTASVKIQ